MGVKRGDSGSSCDSAPTEICQGLPYSHGDYLCTFPIVCPVQHYLVWRVFLKVLDHQVTRASAQKREPPQKLGEAPSYSRPQLNLLLSSRSSFSAQSSCPRSSLSPHPHPLVKLSGRMLLVRLEKIIKHSGRREDSRRRLTGVKTVGNLHLEEIFCLEESSVLRNSSKLLSWGRVHNLDSR